MTKSEIISVDTRIIARYAAEALVQGLGSTSLSIVDHRYREIKRYDSGAGK